MDLQNGLIKNFKDLDVMKTQIVTLRQEGPKRPLKKE